MPMASRAYVKHAEWFIAIFILVDANSAMQDDLKMIKERDGVEDLVVTDATGHVEVGKCRGIHSGCRVWQHKPRKWLRRPWTVGAP